MLKFITWLTVRQLRYLADVCERRGWVTESKILRSAACDVGAIR